MADQKLSPQGSPAKIEVRAKAGSGKRAVIYTRVSTGDQHAETQLYDLRELAKQRRYEIVHEYTDTISGAKSKRPGLESGNDGPAGRRAIRAETSIAQGKRYHGANQHE